MNNKKLSIKSLHGNNQLVNILGSIDDKIENNEKIIEKIDKLLALNFLINFEFKNTFSNKLSDIVSKSNTGADAIQKAPIVDYDTGIKCVRVGDFTNERDVNDWGFCKITNANFKQYQLKKDDILVTRTATLGLSKYIYDECNAVYNNGLIRIICNQKKALPFFVYRLINTNRFHDYISGIEGGSSTRPNMKIEYLLDYKCNIPSLEEQNKYINFAFYYNQKFLILKEQNDLLTKLKQLYLKKFFT